MTEKKGNDPDQHKNDCLVCGKPLVYLGASESIECYYCKVPHETLARCAEGHFVCDTCHSLTANDLIEQFCSASTLHDPVEMAVMLMRSPQVKMHGPEHHFLIPAVLLAAYCNVKASAQEKAEKIGKARKRAENILGGFCGFYGDCGAAVGTGIFMSLVTGATPLSKEEWRLSNLMTAKSLFSIANSGGPRCCKRNTFLAIAEAVEFLKEQFDIIVPAGPDVKCDFTALNKECLGGECRYY